MPKSGMQLNRYLRQWLLLVIVLAACRLDAIPLRVLATGDMHGWLQPTQVGDQWLGGAAEMFATWKQVEGYDPRQFLVISCGDLATGPAISTVFQGEPVIDVMNRMGYDATILGNHDFDFGLERLRAWQRMATFPFLAANLVGKSGKPTDLVAPYLLYEEQGVKVAVIGLILRDIFTYGDSDDLHAQPYAETLRTLVPTVRQQGAQVVIVATHLPFDELVSLANAVTDLRIPLMLGAHDHEFTQRKVRDTWVVNSGLWWRGYSRIDLDYHAENGTTTVLAAKQVWLLQDTPVADTELQAAVDAWQQRITTEYGTLLGYTVTGLKRPDAVYNFVTDSWLAADPMSAIALTHDGSLRQDLPPGPVTEGTLIGLMPFNYHLLRLSLTGKELLAYLPKTQFIGMAGIRRQGTQYRLLRTGKPLAAGTTYRVIITDYQYRTNAALRAADPKPVPLVDDWRQPVRAWLLAHPTSEARPLETLVDTRPRITK